MSSKPSTKQLASSTLSTPPDTYIYSLARTSTTCAAISSDDSLRVFDPSTLSLLHTASNAHKGVTCLRTAGNGRGYVTAGRDAAVRCWDERAGSVGSSMSDPKGSGISALACREFLIAAGTESLKEGLGNVSVLLWDTRNPSTPLRQYTESHNDTITQIAFHPNHPSTLLSAATDGLLSLFDTTVADEDDALLQVLNHKAAVHCAGFLTDDEVFAISSDEQLSVYTLSKPTDAEDAALPIVNLGDVRGSLGCSYVIDIYPSSPAWIAAGDTSASTMSMIPLLPSWSFDTQNAMDFAGAHSDEIVRDVLIDSQNQRILTCGEDGHVRLWAQEGAVSQIDSGAMDVDDGESSKKQRKKERKERKEKKKGEKDRFNPY